MSQSPETPKKNNNDLHKEVLGGIVTVNGFFTGAVFLSITDTVTPLPGIPGNCIAGNDIALKLFLVQISSLAFYILSSLIATAVKLVVVYFDTDSVAKTMSHAGGDSDSDDDEEEKDIRRRMNTANTLSPYVRPWMISSVVFSAVGSSFLLMSIILLVQIKLGLLSCGNTLVVIIVLGIFLILAGLAVYLYISWFFVKKVK